MESPQDALHAQSSQSIIKFNCYCKHSNFDIPSFLVALVLPSTPSAVSQTV